MQKASLVLVNGIVHTMDGRIVSGVACRGEHIAIVGSDSEVLAARGRRTEVVDLGRRLVFPAFTDAHAHFAAFALSRQEIDLKDITSLAEAVRRVAEAAARMPAGTWIIGSGWLHDLWGGTQPDRGLLDAVAPEHLVALWRNDGHAVWVNTAALRRAGIDRDTPDPPGGAILRDREGEPTGVLAERAADRIAAVIPSPSTEDIARSITEAMPLAHRAGLAGLTCMEGLDAYRAYHLLHTRGKLQLRIGICLSVNDLAKELDLIQQEGRGDEWLHWTHLKIFADGALGPRTAWMLEPYDDDPANHGVIVTPPDELRRLIEHAAEHDIGVAVHAIGDAANRAVLDALAATRATWQARRLRPRIEHAQLVARSDIPRFGELGVIASMQPIHATQDMLVAERAWGRRVATAYAFRSLRDAGARLAFGSDTPVETFDVLQGLYAATTRRRADGNPPGGWHPEQCLTIIEAVEAYTCGAAWAEGQEASRGSVAPGKLADLVILDRDIVTGTPEDVLQARVEGTIIGGRWVYRAC
jgi:predicted amidohydrolase YtcJ